jgi:ubiquinone/menaquinone biosynthesis C-methylase UbiE
MLSHSVLPEPDVACGTGVVSRLAAERMGSGRVVGLDINAWMLAVARSLNSPSIEWHEGSALMHVLPKGFHRIRRHANSFNNL